MIDFYGIGIWFLQFLVVLLVVSFLLKRLMVILSGPDSWLNTLLSRVVLLVLWPFWAVLYPVYEFWQQLKFAWGNWDWRLNVWTEFKSSNRAFIRDIKSGRAMRSEAQKKASRQRALDDL